MSGKWTSHARSSISIEMTTHVSRRLFLTGFSIVTCDVFAQSAWGKDEDGRSFAEILSSLAADTQANEVARKFEERDSHQFVYDNGTASGFSQPNRRKGASSRDIGRNAKGLIIASEVSSRAVYEKRRYGFPTWPGGRSGVTIGFGYDIG